VLGAPPGVHLGLLAAGAAVDGRGRLAGPADSQGSWAPSWPDRRALALASGSARWRKHTIARDASGQVNAYQGSR
jgi:hypothetical protein